MEKKKSSDPAELLCAAAKGLIVMAVLFAAGVLAYEVVRQRMK